MIDLGYRPRDWQTKCHQRHYTRRFGVLALHRRAGKTELALRTLLDDALRFTLEMGLFFYVAPQLKQAKAIAWLRLQKMVEPLEQRGLVDINQSELWVRVRANGAMIRLYGADNPDAMRGVRLDGVVIDEVAQIDPVVWDEIIQPALSDRLGWALFIGTPNGINLFSELYFAAGSKAGWYRDVFTVYDTQSIDPGEVERLRRDMSEVAFAREYLCDFNAAGADQLISLTDVELASKQHLVEQDYDYSPRILGVDPARFGDDRSVIQRRQGRLALAPIEFGKLDNMTLAGHVAECIRSWRPDAVFIDEGNGGGVIDRLRQLGHEVIGVHFGGKAGNARYTNKRTEMWFNMRDWLGTGAAIPNNQRLKRDMAAPTYTFTSTSDIFALESKDDIKQRIKASPDFGDALALTFAFPVEKKQRDMLGQVVPEPARGPWDPYATIGAINTGVPGYNPYA